MAVKSLLESVARRLGVEITPLWRVPTLEFSKYLADLIEKRNVRTIIDVGANSGQYRDFIRMGVGYAGRIFSYEPNPDSFRLLESRAATDAAWEVRETALGREQGSLTLNVTESTVFSSFLDPTAAHADLSGFGNLVRNKVTVPVSTLAIEFSREDFLDGIYLKIDTQGFDLNVMLGAGKALERCVAIQTELSMIPIYDGMPGFEEVIRFLGARGFALGNMFPVSRSGNGAVIEFDGVFVNTAC